ncbi:hypothetical protein ACVIGB_000101 [Bradyrhizobium sp. USDA 4341]
MIGSRKPTLGLGGLALLEWVTEKGPGTRFFTQSDSNEIYLYERTVTEDGKPHINRPWPPFGDWRVNPTAVNIMAQFANNVNVDTYQFRKSGFFEHFHPLGHTGLDRKAEVARYEKFCREFVGRKDAFHFSQSIYLPTPVAFSFMAEAGARQLANLRAKRDAARASIARTVVIGRACVLRPTLPDDVQRILPKGATLPLPSRKITRAYATATVVKETANRLYLENIERLPLIGNSTWQDDPISGTDPHRYVEKSAVLLDHASAEAAAALSELDRGYAEDFERLSGELARRTVAAVAEMHSRMLQKDAEYRDSVLEILSGAARRDTAPKP